MATTTLARRPAWRRESRLEPPPRREAFAPERRMDAETRAVLAAAAALVGTVAGILAAVLR